MRKSRFTEAQIIGMIKKHEAGMPTTDAQSETKEYGNQTRRLSL